MFPQRAPQAPQRQNVRERNPENVDKARILTRRMNERMDPTEESIEKLFKERKAFKELIALRKKQKRDKERNPTNMEPNEPNTTMNRQILHEIDHGFRPIDDPWVFGL